MWDGAIQGMNQVRQQNDASNTANINALHNLQGMQKAAIDAEAANAERQRQGAFRQDVAKLSELGQSPTHEQLRGLMMKHGVVAPKDLLTNDLGMYRADATKELGVARLTAAAAERDRQYELAKTKVTNAQQAQALSAWKAKTDIALKTAAAKFGLPADIFNEIQIGQAPSMGAPAQPNAGQPTAPLGGAGSAPTIAPTVTPAEIMRISDPQERAQAMAALQGGRFSPEPAGASPSPVSAPPVANLNTLPTPQPVAAPASSIPAPEMGANEDMRDVMARQARLAQPAAPAPVAPAGAPIPLSAMNGAPQAPSAQAAPNAAPETPKQPTLADAPAGLSPKDKTKWLLQQTKPSIAGAGTLSPAALEFTAKQYLTGDRQAAAGFARSTTARVALQNAIVDEAAKQGKSPEQISAMMAEYAGTTAGSRTVGQRAANIALAATEAQEMLTIVKEQSDLFPRSNFVPWNVALKAYESGTGDPNIAAFGASVNALVNVYARAINPTGVPTVSDKEHARAIINMVQAPQQLDAVLAIINRELSIAKKAPSAVRAQIRESVAPSSGGDYSHLWGGNK